MLVVIASYQLGVNFFIDSDKNDDIWRAMFGVIGFDDLKISCVIGVNHDERNRDQDIFLDLRVEYDFSIPSKNDCFQSAICYEKLSHIAKELAIFGKYQLLESLAVDLMEKLFNEYPIKWASLRIKKPSAIPSAKWAIVEFERGLKG